MRPSSSSLPRRLLSDHQSTSCSATFTPLPRRLLSTFPPPLDPGRTRPVSFCSSSGVGELGRLDAALQVFDKMPHRRQVFYGTSMAAAHWRSGRADDARPLAVDGRRVRACTAMISEYSKCGRILDARRVFDAMPDRNVVSWNAMIAGYVRNADVESAREMFDEMRERDVVSWNAMITGYCHTHMMGSARCLFESSPVRNLVSWTVMISGYVQVNDFAEAWNLFGRMQRDGVVNPDQSNFVAAISAAVGLRDLKLLESLRSWAVKVDLERDVVVGTAILNAYTRSSGSLDAAARFFDGMHERNEFTWSTLISAYSQFGRVDDAAAVFERDPKKSVASLSAMIAGYAQNGKIHNAEVLFERIMDPSVVLWNAMVTGYSQRGMVDKAREMFDRMPVRSSISWAAMIAGYARNRRSKEAIELFLVLRKVEMFPSHSSLTSALVACANIGMVEVGRQIHSLAVKAGYQYNPYVGNVLIMVYSKGRNPEDASQAFGKMKVTDIVSWNSLIVGLSENNKLSDARKAFEQMPNRDVISWTAMISAYVQAGCGKDALTLFLKMLDEGVAPNSLTLSSLISTCADLGITTLGRQIHSFAYKVGRECELYISNALITMYFKCGCKDSFQVFDEMPEHDVVTWNAVLSGCAQHGFAKEAIDLFEEMKSEMVYPNQVTFLTLLCACSHAGMVDEGWGYFYSMSRDYGLMPMEGHYACVVDLLGRAGCLYEAEAFINRMPIEPDSVVWSALLGACRIHRNVEIGRRVAEELFQLEPENPGTYVLLSNIYASLQMWDEVREIRGLMKTRGVTKQPACSWLHVRNKLHFFVTNDIDHKEIKEIHTSLKELYGSLKASGYVPDLNFVLHDLEEEQKDNLLLYHSEKLALAYGLLNTSSCTPIQIMKNLRICGDCHNFVKFVSKEYKREIAIRDRNRFHHFSNGFCSCGDYW